MSFSSIQNTLGRKGGGITEWSSDKTYKIIGECVYRQGHLFIAKATSTGQDPLLDTTHTYWEEVIDTANKNKVIDIVEHDLEDKGFTPVAGTLYQHIGNAGTYKAKGLYYRTLDGYIDLATADAGGIFVGYVSETTEKLPTTRADGSSLQAEDYVKPSGTASLPFTVDGITFASRNDKARWDGEAWYLETASYKTENIAVTEAASESLSGEATTQKEINQELVLGVKSNSARYLTKDALGSAFATYAELSAASTFYYAGEETTPDKNDYVFVERDETHKNAQTRYLWQEGDPGVWAYQYTVNEALADDSLVLTDTGIKVNLQENGGITLVDKEGLAVQIAAEGGLVNKNGFLCVKPNGGIELSANGVKVVHDFKDFSIEVADWAEEENTSLGTSYSATVTATGAKTADMLQVYFDLISILHASDCGIAAEVSATDTIKFYAVEKPETIISGKYEILVAAQA